MPDRRKTVLKPCTPQHESNALSNLSCIHDTVIDRGQLAERIGAELRIRDGWLSVREALAYLGVSIRTLDRLVADGAIRMSYRGTNNVRYLSLEDIRRLADRS